MNEELEYLLSTLELGDPEALVTPEVVAALTTIAKVVTNE